MEKYPFPEKQRAILANDPEELMSLSAEDTFSFRPAVVLSEPDFDNYAELYDLSRHNETNL